MKGEKEEKEKEDEDGDIYVGSQNSHRSYSTQYHVSNLSKAFYILPKNLYEVSCRRYAWAFAAWLERNPSIPDGKYGLGPTEARDRLG